jgi:hypothetical protein
MFYIIRSNFGSEFIIPANIFLCLEVFMLILNVIIEIQIRFSCCREQTEKDQPGDKLTMIHKLKTSLAKAEKHQDYKVNA